VSPHAGEAGQEIFELSQFHLESRLVASRPRGEDVENHFGTVHHADPQVPLEIGPLNRRQLLVEDDEGASPFRNSIPDLRHLALADQRGGIG